MPQGSVGGKAVEGRSMTNSEDTGKAGNGAEKDAKTGAGRDDRKARSARALRENLKKRKQQLKAREKSKN